MNVAQLEQVKEKALGNESQFVVNRGDWENVFTRVQVGSAQYLYYHEHYGNGITLKSEFKLFGIVSDGTLYLNTYVFLKYFETLPQGIVKLTDQQAVFNGELSRLFAEKYKDIPVGELNESSLFSIKKSVRYNILDGIRVENGDIIEELDTEHTAKILNGSLTIEQFLEEDIEKNYSLYVRRKAMEQETNRLYDLQYGVDDMELNLYRSLKALDAKTVTVEFFFNGKYDSEKMEKDRLMRAIRNKDYFTDYDFVTSLAGKELIKRLGARTYRNDENDTLELENISKITYGKKVIFQRSF